MQAKQRKFFAITSACLTGLLLSNIASAESISESKARELITPFYQFLSGEVEAEVGMASMTDDWRSYNSNTEYKVAAETAKGINGLRQHNVTDLKWDIIDVITADGFIVVRGEGSGTPTKDFLGVPHHGKSFKVMSIDIHKVDGDKIGRTWHLENWAQAMRQLTAQ